MNSLIIESSVDGEIKTEAFFLEEETDYAIRVLEDISLKHLGEDTEPYEDGNIGYYSIDGNSVVLRVF